MLTPTDHDGDPDPLRPWEIELPPWLYNVILRRRDILAVHPDYFRLTGAALPYFSGSSSCSGA